MADMTIKQVNYTVTVTNKDGTTTVYPAPAGTAIAIAVEQGRETGFIDVPNPTTGLTDHINLACICKVEKEQVVEDVTFDDGSEPFGCCGA